MSSDRRLRRRLCALHQVAAHAGALLRHADFYRVVAGGAGAGDVEVGAGLDPVDAVAEAAGELAAVGGAADVLRAEDLARQLKIAAVEAIVDGDATVFDSSAILLYLGEKTGRFMPANTPKGRGELLSWMMFVASGVGPYSGQSVHFRNFAPEPKDYAVTRYTFEARRHFDEPLKVLAADFGLPRQFVDRGERAQRRRGSGRADEHRVAHGVE